MTARAAPSWTSLTARAAASCRLGRGDEAGGPERDPVLVGQGADRVLRTDQDRVDQAGLRGLDGPPQRDRVGGEDHRRIERSRVPGLGEEPVVLVVPPHLQGRQSDVLGLQFAVRGNDLRDAVGDQLTPLVDQTAIEGDETLVLVACR